MTPQSDPQLEQALLAALCPPAEVLARFIDDTLEGPHAEHVAKHVLRCEPCQEVVTWTREAEQHQQRRDARRSTGRRRRVRPAPQRAEGAAWLPVAIAAAAGLLFAFVVFNGQAPQPSQPGVAKISPSESRPEVRPSVEPSAQPSASVEPSAQPSASVEPQPSASVEPQPSASVEPQPRPSVEPQPRPSVEPQPRPSVEPSPKPTTTERPDAQPSPAPARAMVQVAALGAGLALEEEGERRSFSGAALVPAGTEVIALRANALMVDERRVRLEEKARLGLAKESTSLVEGQGLFEGAGRVDHGKRHSVETESAGDRVFLDARGAQLFVVVLAGKARVRVDADVSEISAGEGAVLEDGVRPLAQPAPLLNRARVSGAALDRAAALPVPGGLALLRGLRGARQALVSDDVALQARGLRAVEAALTAGGAFAAAAADLQLRALRVHELLDAKQPSALVAAGAAADFALAEATRLEGRRVKGEQRDRLLALAEAIASASGASESADSLLALRAIEKVTRKKLSRSLWSKLERPEASDPESTLRALLIKGSRLAPAAQRALAAPLAGDPLELALTPARLWTLRQALILGRAWTPERAARFAAHLEASATAHGALELVFLATDHDVRALGGKTQPVESSREVVRVGEGYRVRFLLRSAQRGLREAWICGSWDTWSEDASPMVRQPDGRFAVTLELAAGRHEYKLRPASGDWELDADNELRARDENGRINSVLLLP